MGEGLVTADGNIPLVVGKPKVGDRVLYLFNNRATGELDSRPAIVVRTWPDTPDQRINIQVFLDSGADTESFGHEVAVRGLAYKRQVPQCPMHLEGGQAGSWMFIRE
jgi:hypothetical protein